MFKYCHTLISKNNFQIFKCNAPFTKIKSNDFFQLKIQSPILEYFLYSPSQLKKKLLRLVNLFPTVTGTAEHRKLLLDLLFFYCYEIEIINLLASCIYVKLAFIPFSHAQAFSIMFVVITIGFPKLYDIIWFC